MKTKLSDLRKPEGTLLGMSENQAVTTDENVIVFGFSASGKSTQFVKPNVIKDIENNNSIVISSPLHELQRQVIPLAKEKGYDVKILNLSHLGESDKWNPLKYIWQDNREETLKKASTLTHVIFAATGDESGSFFDQAEENLLKSLMLYVTSPEYEGEKTLSSIYNLLLKLAQNSELPEVENLPNEHISKPFWLIFNCAGKQKSNFVAALALRLSMLLHPEIENVLSENEIDFEKIGKEKCLYVVDAPLFNRVLTPIANIFMDCLLDNLSDVEIPVHIILDEFSSLGRLQKIHSALRERKPNVRISLVMQSFFELKDKYPATCWDMVNQCVPITFQLNETKTAELFCGDLRSNEKAVDKLLNMKRGNVAVKDGPIAIYKSYIKD